MKKFILIFTVCVLNILFFQNFTSITDQERVSWGAQISESEDNTYDDFRNALEDSNEELNDVTKSWNDKLEEVEPEEDQEVGIIVDESETPL